MSKQILDTSGLPVIDSLVQSLKLSDHFGNRDLLGVGLIAELIDCDACADLCPPA
jgi:hypothetical protein